MKYVGSVFGWRTHSFRQPKKVSSLSLSISICLCGKIRTSIVRSVQSAIARSSSSSTYVCARAYSSDFVPERKVAVWGSVGGIGQPLALLMKLNPFVPKLSLYDIASTPGVAVNVSHINTRSEDCNPKIFDFSTMSGKIFGKLTRLKNRLLNFGYDDPEDCPLGGPEEGGFEVTYLDVFSFGVVLMGLIAKRIVDKKDTWKTFVYRWAWKQYRPNRSLVHESLIEDPGYYASDGIMITELAMRCIQRELDKRPSMKDVVKRLEGSQVVQLYGNVVGM